MASSPRLECILCGLVSNNPDARHLHSKRCAGDLKVPQQIQQRMVDAVAQLDGMVSDLFHSNVAASHVTCFLQLQKSDEAGYVQARSVSMWVKASNTSQANPYQKLSCGDNTLRYGAGNDDIDYIDHLMLRHFNETLMLPILSIRYLINGNIDYGVGERQESLLDSLAADRINRHYPQQKKNVAYNWWVEKSRIFTRLSDEEVVQL